MNLISQVSSHKAEMSQLFLDEGIISGQLVLFPGRDDGHPSNTEFHALWNESCSIVRMGNMLEIGTGSTGAYVNNDSLIICGGSRKECHKSIPRQFYVRNDFMTTERAFAASIVVGNYRLLVVGGERQNPSETLRTSEFIGLNGLDEIGPQLPQPTQNMCFLKISSSMAMMIGGKDIDSGSVYKSTYFFDIVAEDTFTKGPDLIYSRQGHACGILMINKMVHVVVLSGSDDSDKYRGTEYWTPSLGVFKDEDVFPKYPLNVRGSQVNSHRGMVTTICKCLLSGNLWAWKK